MLSDDIYFEYNYQVSRCIFCVEKTIVFITKFIELYI